jgi:class 3 adenylate cyclase
MRPWTVTMEPHERDSSSERRSARTPFVGREIELEWLLERVGQAARGRPRACIVRGEPGSGKSRLLAELGRLALARGIHLWSVRGSPEVQTPYLALDALIQSLATRCLCGPALAEASSRWWQHLRSERSGAPGSLETGPLAREQRALSLAFQRAMLERATHGGFLLLIDDLQWLDGPSLELVVDAIVAAGEAANEESVALAVVMASRGGEPGSSAVTGERRLELELSCDSLVLTGFGDRESEEFLRALGIDPPARALATRLREAARGSPARLDALVRELRRRGALLQRGRSWITKIDPVEIREELGPHLDLAGDDPLRRTLRLLGLFVEGATREAFAAVSGLPREQVELELGLAEACGWLRARGGCLSFEDPALGRALAAEIPEAERPALHHRIARFLAGSKEGAPELLAYHWQHAWPEAPGEAVVEALRAAALQAMRARDWRRAAFQFERALQVAEASDASLARRAELHYRAGLAHFRSLDGEPSRIHFEQAAEAYERGGDRAGNVRARVERMRSIVALGASAYGSRAPDLEELERLIETLGEEELALRAYATSELAVAYSMARDTRSAEPRARRAVDLANGSSDDVRCLTHEMLGIVLMGKLDLEGAVRAFGESLRFGRRTGDAWLESLALNRLPIALAWQGRLDEARSYLLAARDAAEATGDWADYSLTLGTLAGLGVARGDFDEVEAMARQAVSIARRSGYGWGAAIAISAVAPARALRGRLDEARDAAALLEKPGALAREIPPLWGAMAAVLRLRLSALAGEAEASAREQAAGIASLLLAMEVDPQVLPALCACIEVAASVGDGALAERAGAAVAAAARHGVVFTAALDDVLARTLGLVAETLGKPAEAILRFEEALQVAERCGARVLQARIHADLARVLEAEGRGPEARENAERALALAERLGMEPLRAACARRLARAGAAAGVPERAESLGAADRRLLRGIASGLDESALASDLLLTREGLGRLRERLFARIGASGNVEAAAFAHREGLVARGSGGLGTALAEITRRAPPVHGREPRALTLFISDIANSSELIQRLGDEEAQDLIQEHNRIVRMAFRLHLGVELQHTGDGFIASFDSAAQALRCAIRLQQELQVRRLGPPDSPLRVRVGLHQGEPLLEEGRLFGVAMHTAARICGAGEGGEILISGDARTAVGSDESFASEDLGPVQLRGIFEPVSLHRVHWARKRAEV